MSRRLLPASLLVNKRRQVQVAKLAKRIEAARGRHNSNKVLSAKLLIEYCQTYRGEDLAARLMLEFPGSRLPKLLGYLSLKRIEAVLRDYFERGWRVCDVAARHQLAPDYVTQLVRKARRAARRAKNARPAAESACRRT